MYAAVDVHYPPSGGARAALVLAPDAALSTIASDLTFPLGPVSWIMERGPGARSGSGAKGLARVRRCRQVKGCRHSAAYACTISRSKSAP